MPCTTENEWDIVEPETMDSSDSTLLLATHALTKPTVQLTVNHVTAKPEEKKVDEKTVNCTCGTNNNKPQPEFTMPVPAPAPPTNPFAPGITPPPSVPMLLPPPPPFPLLGARGPTNDTSNQIKSSSELLNKVSKHDGLAELPFLATNTPIYLSTFPFSDKDVKKWSWLFSLGIQDDYLAPGGHMPYYGDSTFSSSPPSHNSNDDDNDSAIAFPFVRLVQSGATGPDAYRYLDPGTVPYNDRILSVFLSRALDETVIGPGNAAKNVRYLIVMQNYKYPGGSKLVITESRAAAGMLMFYQLLKADSVVFVGAVCCCSSKMRVHPRKFKRVETLDEAVEVQKEGFVGVVC